MDTLLSPFFLNPQKKGGKNLFLYEFLEENLQKISQEIDH